MTLKAFHGDPLIKRTYLSRVKAHEKADEIIKGQYWKEGKGCAVGCTIHGDNHSAYETELGIPEALARLQDNIFEGLPNSLAKTWPARFLKAIRPGADLSKASDEFIVWLLTDEKYGVLQFAMTDEAKEAIQTVSDLFLFKLAGAYIHKEDWGDAANAATYAAYAATNAATYAANAAYYAATYATDAADAATYAATFAATFAACSAYAANVAAYAAYATAGTAIARVAQSEKLLSLLKGAK